MTSDETAELERLRAEVAGLEALLSGCFIPLSIREVRRLEGTQAAGKRWHEQSQGFLSRLQEERAWAEQKFDRCFDAHERAIAQLAQVTRTKDAAYSERNQLAALVARMALALGWAAGTALHPAEDTEWEADWRTILFVHLPTGQASWHFHDSERHLLAGLPVFPWAWDGHRTDAKYERVRMALTPVPAQPRCRHGFAPGLCLVDASCDGPTP